MQHSSTKKKRKWRGIKIFLGLVILINLLIILSGHSYLYKGIRYTYFRGTASPTIYDSIVFPTNTAHHAIKAKKWSVSYPLRQLSDSAIVKLKATSTTSFLIERNDTILVEQYFGNHTKSTKSNSFSAAKSVVALLIGIALDEGKIKSLDDPIAKYLPFLMENAKNVTIREVMGMSSGLDWSESGINPFSDNAEAYYTNHLVDMIKDKGFTAAKPGIKFNYKSGNTEILGIILKNVTGMSPTKYLEEKIWSKIGTQNNLLWSLDEEGGIEKAFCCIYATTRDFARLGQLLLNQGKWKGKEIIDSTTLQALTTAFNPNYPFYGLQFWIYDEPKHPAVYFRGIKGQYIIVIPSLNTVIVRTGHHRKDKYHIPKAQQSNQVFVDKNKYKKHHPMDMGDYYKILYSLLDIQ